MNYPMTDGEKELDNALDFLEEEKQELTDEQREAVIMAHKMIADHRAMREEEVRVALAAKSPAKKFVQAAVERRRRRNRNRKKND